MGTLVVATIPSQGNEDLRAQAAAADLVAAGFTQFTQVQIGRRYVLNVEGPVTEAHIEAAREAAEKVLLEPDREQVVRIVVTDNDTPVAPWEDFEQVWGGDEGLGDEGMSETVHEHEHRKEAHGYAVSEKQLGAVEGSSAAWYADADEN